MELVSKMEYSIGAVAEMPNCHLKDLWWCTQEDRRTNWLDPLIPSFLLIINKWCEPHRWWWWYLHLDGGYHVSPSITQRVTDVFNEMERRSRDYFVKFLIAISFPSLQTRTLIPRINVGLLAEYNLSGPRVNGDAIRKWLDVVGIYCGSQDIIT